MEARCFGQRRSWMALVIALACASGPMASELTLTSRPPSGIDLTFCFQQPSSSTAPALLQFDIPVPAVASGDHAIRLNALIRAENGEQCRQSVTLLESIMRVVDATDKRTVVEYYDAGRAHYFQTADADEIAALDGGVLAGWQRTGSAFSAYAPGVVTPGAKVKPVFPDPWILERENAFAVALPAAGSGECASGTLPVYRVLNAQFDINHRYTTSLAVRQQMIDGGWIPEGYGSIGVAMCSEVFE